MYFKVLFLCILSLTQFVAALKSHQNFLDNISTDEQIKHCFQQENLTIEDAKNAADGKPLSRQFFCYFKCLFESVNFLKDDGKFNTEKAKALFGDVVDDKAQQCLKSLTISTCQDLNKLDDCLPDP